MKTKRTLAWVCAITTFCLTFFSTSNVYAGRRPSVTSINIDLEELISMMMPYVCDHIEEHMTSGAHATGTEFFLSWHRDYIAGLEDYLLTIPGGDKYVPFPAWDVTKDCLPMALLAPEAFCDPEDADFYSDFSVQNPLCLTDNSQIDFDDFDTCEKLCTLTNVDVFSNLLEGQHNAVHTTIGGVMGPMATSPMAAMFWFYHAWIDEIYYDYQVAHMRDELPLEIEDETSCGELRLKVLKSECLSSISWSTPMQPSDDGIITSEDNDYYYATIIGSSDQMVTVAATITSVCNKTKTLSGTFNLDCTVPEIPSVPPLDLQYICLDAFENCFDFANVPCVNGYEVTSSSSKIIGSSDGSTLCLSTLTTRKFVATVKVTPLSEYCGSGATQTWTVYVNYPDYCPTDDPWGGLGLAENPSLPEAAVSIFPNPFNNKLELNVNNGLMDQMFQVSVFNALGEKVETTLLQGASALDTSHYSGGIYFVVVTNAAGQTIHSEKLMKY